MKIVVTGANGFVGTALCTRLLKDGHQVTALTRRLSQSPSYGVTWVKGDMLSFGPWQTWLAGQEIVIHLAAVAHQVRSRGDQSAMTNECQSVNRDATLALAKLASASGVRRFIYVSTIGVNGTCSGQQPFTEMSPALPQDGYAVSKYQAECGLSDFVERCAMELVIVRPPLVYGTNAPGNFSRLMRLIARGIPLPLAAVDNRRSLIAVENLVDFLQLCSVHSAAAGECFLVSDGKDISTPELVRQLASGMKRPACLVWVPLPLLRVASRLTGLERVYSGLCGTLQIDASKAERLLGWRPAVSFEAAIRSVGEEYLKASAVFESTISENSVDK